MRNLRARRPLRLAHAPARADIDRHFENWTQCWGGAIEEIRPGDMLWCPPGVKHWHGTSPKTAMTHIAVTELLNGKNVDWLEKVTDEQYLAGP
jgi:mannose-6-phosphate isomerase-like protein (cupin superfamily)